MQQRCQFLDATSNLRTSFSVLYTLARGMLVRPVLSFILHSFNSIFTIKILALSINRSTISATIKKPYHGYRNTVTSSKYILGIDKLILQTHGIYTGEAIRRVHLIQDIISNLRLLGHRPVGGGNYRLLSGTTLVLTRHYISLTRQ